MATEIFYTSSPSEYLKLEGLYITEKDPPGFIEGVHLNEVGFVGQTSRGPLTIQKITGKARFREVYGDRGYQASDLTIRNRVWEALINKQFGAIHVRRVAAAAAALGTRNLSDAVPTVIVRVDASSVGAWSVNTNGGPTVSVEAATNGNALHFNLRVKFQGAETVYENLNVQTGSNNLLEVIGDDLGNLITVTKIADGRPINIADQTLAGGSDGSVANSDYTTAVTEMANADGPYVVVVPEAAPTQSTLNGTIVTLAGQVSDKIFLVWAGVHNNSVSAEIAAQVAQITTKSDRIVWCYNSPKTVNPDDGTKIQVAPHVWLASILSQIDGDVHAGSNATKKLLAGVAEVQFPGLTRDDLKSLRAAGITTLEKVRSGFKFRSVVTTDLTKGKTELTRRTMTDFLQISASERLVDFVKEKNTLEKRIQMIGELQAFGDSLQKEGRYIEEHRIESETVNTQLSRSQGIEKILWRVNLIDHMLAIVLETEIGTGTVIQTA